MAVTIRYEPNHGEFRKLMMSEQTHELADEAADLGLAVARAYAAGYKLPAAYITSIRKEVGRVVVLGGNPRRAARIYADFPYIEFGSGIKGEGGSRHAPRPQGGYSAPYRILGRTGSRIGKPPSGGAG